MDNLSYKPTFLKSQFAGFLFFIGIYSFLCYGIKAQPLVPATDTGLLRYYPNLTVFIGTPVPDQRLNKDSTAHWPNDIFMSDGVLRIKYLVKEWVYGLEKPPDTLEMISYDHYSSFSFLNSKYAMLYVYKNRQGSYTQQRYKYHNVYPTIGGGWAGPPEVWMWYIDSNHLVPRIMPFMDSIRIRMHVFEDSTYFPDELADMREAFPEPYFYLNQFDMITMYGNEILELFDYTKRELIETAIFDERNADENGVITVPDVELSEVNEVNEENDTESPKELNLDIDQFKAYMTFYYTLIRVLKSNDFIKLNQLLLPELTVCDSVWSRSKFIQKFIPIIKERFQRSKDFKFEKLKAAEWKGFYEVHIKNYTVIKDSLGHEFTNDWIKPKLDFKLPQNELFVLNNYFPGDSEQKEFNLHLVFRNGQFYLFGMHFTRMRHCYR